MVSSVLLIAVMLNAVMNYDSPPARLLVDLPTGGSLYAGTLVRVRVSIENEGRDEIVVPKYFVNALGTHPHARLVFESEGGKVIYDQPAETLPIHFPPIEDNTISLRPGASYGWRFPTVLPSAPGCYKVKAILLGWTERDLNKVAPRLQKKVLTGDLASEPVVVCVTSRPDSD